MERMAERIWDRFLTEEDKAVFEAAGYGTRAGFGERPVVVLVDVTYAFTGEEPEPILDSIRKWPTACGPYGWDAVPHLVRLVEAARAKDLPVVYTVNSGRADRWDAGSWNWKKSPGSAAPRPQAARERGDTIVAEIAPGPRDIVIRKLKPSAFHGTALSAFLRLFKADSIILAGTTTSGCVRATTLDAFNENLRVAVVEEACFDRSQSSHAMSLCDMNAKYADVVGIDEVVRYVEGLPAGLFALPPG